MSEYMEYSKTRNLQNILKQYTEYAEYPKTQNKRLLKRIYMYTVYSHNSNPRYWLEPHVNSK